MRWDMSLSHVHLIIVIISWFWQRQRAKRKEPPPTPEMSLAEYLQRSQIRGGCETVVGGRRCPAHEDATGFANALVSYL